MAGTPAALTSTPLPSLAPYQDADLLAVLLRLPRSLWHREDSLQVESLREEAIQPC